MYNNRLLTAVHETVILFLKPDVKFFVLFDLLLTASNLIFDLGLSVSTQVKFRRICMESSEHNWV